MAIMNDNQVRSTTTMHDGSLFLISTALFNFHHLFSILTVRLQSPPPIFQPYLQPTFFSPTDPFLSRPTYLFNPTDPFSTLSNPHHPF